MRSNKLIERVVEGSEAVALAVKACRPEVISSFPISPQTHIVEALARMVAEGDLASEYVAVDSEFSAASVISGASAAGSRAYTASTSQGLLLMTEVIYASAGMRLPFVLTGVNRAISAPISIQPDNQDAMSLRDSGILQFYVESCQEAYDMHLAAFKIAEDPGICLPVMICMDGWILTHSYERVKFLAQSEVDSFLPSFKPKNFLDVENPKSWGPIADEDLYMEFRFSVHDAMEKGKKRINEVLSELHELTGRDHGGLIEKYRTEGADIVFVAMGSIAGTTKDAVDDLISEGKSAGLIKLRCFRPFPYEELIDALRGIKAAVILDSNISMSSEGAISLDLKSKLYGMPDPPIVFSVIAGLGGKVVNKNTIYELFNKAEKMCHSKVHPSESYWMDLNHSVL